MHSDVSAAYEAYTSDPFIISCSISQLFSTLLAQWLRQDSHMLTCFLVIFEILAVFEKGKQAQKNHDHIRHYCKNHLPFLHLSTLLTRLPPLSWAQHFSSKLALWVPLHIPFLHLSTLLTRLPPLSWVQHFSWKLAIWVPSLMT